MYKLVAALWFIAGVFAVAAGIGYVQDGEAGLAALWFFVWIIDMVNVGLNLHLDAKDS